ncbi:MAG: hypothetical protein KatS3mg117_0049 [Geminicoccaceae bacterium]|nr:MAG: hypothetical protein KatS3mg117_0049 [Geminicoccaceae bacterium]
MTPRSIVATTLLAGASLVVTSVPAPPAFAQTAGSAPALASPAPAGAPAEAVVALEAAKRLVAPVALYPDPILSAVLEAATTPLDVVEAERFLGKRTTDPTLAPDSDWSPAILALLNHPDLLRRMSEDLDWTRTLGAAVVEDLEAVQRAIQEIRKGALALGILADTEFQRIVREDDLVAIEPVDPEAVRLPIYDAEQLLAALGTAPAASLAASEPAPASEPPVPRPKPEPPADAAKSAPAAIAAVPQAPAWTPPAAYEPYPAAPAPSVSYAAPERGFWSDAAIFAGGAALGGVLGYLLADRDDDKKVVKKYYYFGDRRPPGWWNHRIHWRDEGWRPGARIVRADKIVIKDSNVVITGNDVVVRRLSERRNELLRVARSGDLPPERWHDWERAKRRERDGAVVLLREARPEPVRERPRIAVLPERRGERDRRGDVRPAIAVLPDRRGEARIERSERSADRPEVREAVEQQRRLERQRLLEAGRAQAEERRLERDRARDLRAAAERQAREERRRREALELERQRARAEARAQEERRRAAELQRLERARAAELARAREIERRQAEEQAKLLRRQEREAQRLERQERRARDGGQRAERRGGGQGQDGKKRRLWQEG